MQYGDDEGFVLVLVLVLVADKMKMLPSTDSCVGINPVLFRSDTKNSLAEYMIIKEVESEI